MKRLLCFFLCALLVMGNMNLTVLAEGMGQNAELDRDDTSSYGPETTTIYGTVEGEYLFTVHNYSGTPDMTVSDATVKVYFGNQQKPYKTYYIPKEKTGYRYWKVFKYNTKTRQITPINEMSNVNGY